MTLPRIYVAHPITSYGTEHGVACLDSLADLLPGADLVDPAALFTTSAQWLDAWPAIVQTLAGLVVFGAADGTIGSGCLLEVADAMAAELPVAAFEEGPSLVELVGVEFLRPALRTARCVGVLVPGEPIDWPDLSKPRRGQRASAR
ncbi:MAG: hypothetical protein ACLPR9_04555 [Acidimicrobiales bacterium]